MALQHRSPLSDIPIFHRRMCTVALGCFELLGFHYVILHKLFTSTLACYNFKTWYIYIYSGFDHETDEVVKFKQEVTVAVFYNILLAIFHLCSFTKQSKLYFQDESVLYQCCLTFVALESHCSQRLLSCIHQV